METQKAAVPDMKIQRVKKLTVALLVTCALFVTACFAVSAGQYFGRGWGYTTAKYDGRVDWKFYSNVSPSAPSKIASTKWESATAVNGASVTAKRAVISENTTAMSIGYMSCSYFGESIFSNKIIVNQMTNAVGTVRTDVKYGVLQGSE